MSFHIIPILLATSRASYSGVSTTYAFFKPSGLTRVFTLLTLMLYNSWHAFLIIGLFDLLSTIKTRVLLSSIVLMALSVLNGYLMIAYLSQVCSFLTLFLSYFGFLSRARVAGRLKVTLVHTLCFLLVWVPFLTADAAVLAAVVVVVTYVMMNRLSWFA